MPPKRGRGRGRGAPPGRPEADAPGPQIQEQRQPPGFDTQPQRGRGRQPQQAAPPGFFAPSSSVEPTYHAPPTEVPKTEKPKMKTVHPEELGIELKQKLAISLPLPPRPEVGNLGRRIKLISNCFPIKIPSGDIYHYDVDITQRRRNPESDVRSSDVLPVGLDKKDKKYRCLSTKRNRQIVQEMLDNDKNFNNLYAAYDGQKNLYTRKPIGSSKLKCVVCLPDENPGNPSDPRGPREDVFEVQIKPVKKKDTESCAISLDSVHALFEKRTTTVPQEAIMALETILRHGPCLKFTPVGRSFFYPPREEDCHPLGGGREIWFGYHQSLRLGQWKPMVNLDITATTFYEKAPVLKYIADFLGTNVRDLDRRPQVSAAELKRISGELKNMRIEVTHLSYRRKYRIFRLVAENANRLSFPLTENGEQVRRTVADYFRQTHKIELKYPHLPCIQVNPENKKIYLPVEVCEMVEGQHCKKKLEDRQNADMIKFTARPPAKRFDEIRDIVNKAAFQNDRYVREFGIEVSRTPLNLEGRVLDAPTVRYNNNTHIRPRDGSWNMEKIQFFRGAAINCWVLVNFSNPNFCREDNLSRFAQLLTKIGRESGMEIQRPVLIMSDTRRFRDVKALIKELKSKHKADLVVAVVPAKNKSVYGEIKQAAETEGSTCGLTTQCVKDDNVVKKCNPALVSNLCQKINAKMGGVNNALMPEQTPPILRKPVIIIGADVTHPGPSHDIKPSLAACVGSLDAHPSRYAVTCRAQTNVDEKKQAVEIILDLKTMILDLLKAFYRHTGGKKPEKILFYRDGVSEGQFDKVKDYEVKCIREACKTLNSEYKPGITFIVVQKRHHTRFMPGDPRDGTGKMKNIPPGTTVDTTVTHPLNFDFFLCSHFGLQGTSRPSHYTVIEDDNDFSANDLQKLTYYLCHTYVRCTKSISVPAPVAYAHLAAYRARQHLVSQVEDDSASSTSSSEFHELPQSVIDAIRVVDGLKSTMYFV